jgi:hypothetical protein
MCIVGRGDKKVREEKRCASGEKGALKNFLKLPP